MDRIVLAPAGRLDSLAAAAFHAMVTAALPGCGHTLVLDFAAVPYVSSAALRVILIATKAMAGKGGEVVLAGLGPQVAEVIESSGFNNLPNLRLESGATPAGQ